MKDHIKKSKFLALVLRHKPEEANITLDSEGWTDIKNLLDGCKSAGVMIDSKELLDIVNSDDKKRYSIDGSKIRANQGHSININITFEEKEPPDLLYHGTLKSNINLLYASGIKKMARHHVHLSCDSETAFKVGRRRGTPMVFKIDAQQMHKDGIKFFISDNGVWLTDYVTPEYLSGEVYEEDK